MPHADLEREKLAAEVASLRGQLEVEQGRLDFDQKAFRRGRIALISATLIALVTIGSGGFGTFVAVSNYLHQQERLRDFELDQKLITLVKDLHAPEPITREAAALLLSSYEADAVPILLWSLGRSEDINTASSILESLRMIHAKPGVEAHELVRPLCAATHGLTAEELEKEDPESINAVALAHHLTGLGEFSASLNPESDHYEAAIGQVHEVLNGLQVALAARDDLPLAKSFLICDAAKKAGAQVGASWESDDC